MSGVGSYTSDSGTGAAVPDIDRVLSVLDAAFFRDALPVEDVALHAAVQPALISSDGDAIFESSTAGADAQGREWGAEEAMSSSHIIKVMKQEEDAAALVQALGAAQPSQSGK